MEPTEEYAYIEDVSESDCYEKWEGVDWTANDEYSDVGICESNYDFDAWAEEYEGESNASDS